VQILIGVLDAFGLTAPVSVMARCGGAATTMRCVCRYPRRFAGMPLVFHNSVTSEWLPAFDQVGLRAVCARAPDRRLTATAQALQEHGCRLLVTWRPDPDHAVWCVSYKHLDALRRSRFAPVRLVDLDAGELSMPSVHVPCRTVPGMTRCRADVTVYTPSPAYVDMLVQHLTSRRR
jgi:hypothetical protein